MWKPSEAPRLARSTSAKPAAASACDLIPLSYRSPKTEVRPSPIQGKGLFATEGAGAVKGEDAG